MKTVNVVTQRNCVNNQDVFYCITSTWIVWIHIYVFMVLCNRSATCRPKCELRFQISWVYDKCFPTVIFIHMLLCGEYPRFTLFLWSSSPEKFKKILVPREYLLAKMTLNWFKLHNFWTGTKETISSWVSHRQTVYPVTLNIGQRIMFIRIRTDWLGTRRTSSNLIKFTNVLHVFDTIVILQLLSGWKMLWVMMARRWTLHFE